MHAGTGRGGGGTHELGHAGLLEVRRKGGLGLLAGGEVLEEAVGDLGLAEQRHEVVRAALCLAHVAREDLRDDLQNGALGHEAVVEHGLEDAVRQHAELLRKDQRRHCTQTRVTQRPL